MWGRAVNGYSLHPAYEGAVTANSLIAEFASTPTRVDLLFSKPKDALLASNGGPTLSDGVTISVRAFDRAGHLTASAEYPITQAEFLARRWVKKTIAAGSGVAKLEVRVGAGGLGSTPYFDSTLVGFEVKSLRAGFVWLGKMLLAGLAFFLVALVCVTSASAVSFARSASALVQRLVQHSAFPYAVVSAAILAVAFWSLKNSSFIYFWDYRNYWQKTETLYELMIAGSWQELMSSVAQSYSADYSLVPAILPALLSLIGGHPGRLSYPLIITAAYAVPAYIAVAYLGKRLVAGAANVEKGSSWAYASLVVFVSLPVFFGQVLNLMPDIGGVVLFVMALLYGESIVASVAAAPNSGGASQLKDLLRSSLGFGLFCSAMFLFRRWYAFAVVGMSCVMAILVLRAAVVDKENRGLIIKHAGLAVAAIGLAILPFVSWVLLDWVKDARTHNYSDLYASYKHSLGVDMRQFFSTFGAGVLVVCAASILLTGRDSRGRRLSILLAGSSFIAAILFMRVQSPGMHHYYLLMPLLGGGMAAFSLALRRRNGPLSAVALGLLILGGNALTTMGSRDQLQAILPGYASWLPKEQPFEAGYVNLVNWLNSPPNHSKRFCVVASSSQINQGVFDELWQIIPGLQKDSFSGRIIHLGEVDSRDGAPIEAVKSCEIALVGTPLQTHLDPGQQYSVQIVQEDLMGGTGIGAAFDRNAKVFEMDANTKMYAYLRNREVSEVEYADLVDRFRKKRQL